ncbi:BON domain-containing protein [Maricaulis sp. D1M11]|uniref:BON domain-containing protein n=1 Tax=Maricaulis sp. D1M11 TaxID=3076117 RepID=UPI0039B4F14E
MRRFLIAGCLSLLAATGCSSIQEERSFGREVDDNTASFGIKSAMLRSEGYDFGGVQVEVTEGIALLVGTVSREVDKQQAECLAWSSPAVRSVANVLEIGPDRTVGERSRDTLTAQNVRGRLLADRSVRSVNFNVIAFRNTLYLLGVARSRGELERATSHASISEGVDHVVSYVRVSGVPTDLPSRGERRAAACGGESLPALEPHAANPI